VTDRGRRALVLIDPLRHSTAARRRSELAGSGMPTVRRVAGPIRCCSAHADREARRSARHRRARSRPAICRRQFRAGYAPTVARGIVLATASTGAAAIGETSIGPATRRTVGIPDPANSLRLRAAVEWRSGSISTSARGPGPSPCSPLTDSRRGVVGALVALSCDSVLVLGREMSVVCADSARVRWTTSLQNRVSLPVARAP